MPGQDAYWVPGANIDPKYFHEPPNLMGFTAPQCSELQHNLEIHV